MNHTETSKQSTAKRPAPEDELPSMPNWGVKLIRFVGLNLSRLLFRIRYTNMENIPPSGAKGLLVCANHQSFFDPFWIGFQLVNRNHKLRFMTWDAATKWILVGTFIRSLGAFPVNIERGGKAALKMSLGWLRANKTLMVFPEGTRTFSHGRMLEFKNGAVKLALDTGVSILPVTIIGANRVWAQDMKFPRFGTVEIIYHPLFEITPAPAGVDAKEHLNNLTEKLAEIIGSALPK